LVSPKTLEYYDGTVCRSSTSLRVRASSASRTRTSTARNGAERCSRSPGRHGRLRQPDTDHDSHRAIRAFLHWARKEGYEVDPLILDLSGPRVPKKEPTVYHIAQATASCMLGGADCPKSNVQTIDCCAYARRRA